jgi:GYF domain 2
VVRDSNIKKAYAFRVKETSFLALWYYLLKGRPQGPISFEDLKKEVAAGRIGPSDLIYQERDTQWRPVSSQPDLKGPVASEEKPSVYDWVLLVRKSDGSGYKQRGPFSKEQVVQKLKGGEISFTDYVWRKGLTEWYKILALPDFHNPFSTQTRNLPPLPSTTNVEIDEPRLSDEITSATKNLPMPEEETKPSIEMPKAPNVTTAATKASRVTTITSTSEVKKHIKRPKNKAKSATYFVKRIGIINYFLDLTPIRKVLYIMGMVATFTAGILLTTQISTYLDRQNIKLVKPGLPTVVQTKESTQKIVQNNKQKPNLNIKSDTQAVSSAVQAAKVEEVKVRPTYLQLSKEGDGTGEAILRVKSDGTRHYSIKLTFQADGGEVLDTRSFYRVARIYRIEDRDYRLKENGFLGGNYTVVAESEGVKSEPFRIKFDTETAAFKKAINAHRKRLTIFNNEERVSFIKTVSRLERETIKLAQSVENAASLNSWSGFYKSWRKTFDRIQDANIAKINNKNRNNYVHAALWVSLKELRIEIDKESRSLNSRKSKGETIDAKNIKASAQGLSRLKDQMLQSSLWK